MTQLKNQALRGLPGFLMTLLFVFLCAQNAAARDVALVTGKNTPPKVVKAADLAKAIKTTHKWPDGSDLTLVLTDPSSPEMRIVATRLLSLTSDEFKQTMATANQIRVTFWVVSSDDEALRVLQANPSAVGLVNVYSINSSVNVSKIDGKLPLEPGYILHSQ